MNTSKSNSIFSAMSDGVLIICRGGKVDYANPAAHHILNMADNIDSVTNLLDSLVCHKINDPFIDLIVKAVSEAGTTQHSLVKYQNPSEHGKDAPVKMLEVKTSYSVENEEPIILLMFTDVTQREERNTNCRDSGIIVSVLMGILFLYAFVFSLIDMVADLKSIQNGTFTWICLGVGTLLCILTYRFTSLSLAKNTMKLSNLKSGAKMALRYIPIILGAFILLKFILVLLLPQTFPEGMPFFNWKRFTPGNITLGHLLYPFSALLQEFLARLFLHDNIVRIFEVYGPKKAGAAAVILSSLMFACIHMHHGFYFMLGAFFLSIFLGIFYYKTSNFWLVLLIHCIVGDIGVSLIS